MRISRKDLKRLLRESINVPTTGDSAFDESLKDLIKSGESEQADELAVALGYDGDYSRDLRDHYFPHYLDYEGEAFDKLLGLVGVNVQYRLNDYLKYGGNVFLDDDTGEVLITHDEYVYILNYVTSMRIRRRYIPNFCASWSASCAKTWRQLFDSVLMVCNSLNITNMFLGDFTWDKIFFKFRAGNENIIKLQPSYFEHEGKLKVNGEVIKRRRSY